MMPAVNRDSLRPISASSSRYLGDRPRRVGERVICSILTTSTLLQGCARDLLDRDRDETETLSILSETRPRRDVLDPRRDRDIAAPETLPVTYDENH